MKRLVAFARGARGGGKRLIALCYALFLLCSLAYAIFGIAEDAVRRMAGDVVRLDIPGGTEGAFSLTELEQDGTLYVSTGIDPRMELNLDALFYGGAPVYVRRITLRVEYLNLDPGELCVFYKLHSDMEHYDASDRAWARREAEPGVYTFNLPRGALYGLRLDPGIYNGMRFVVESVTLNEPRPIWDWLRPTRPWLLAAAVVPLLAASALQYLIYMWDAPRGWARPKKTKPSERGAAT